MKSEKKIFRFNTGEAYSVDELEAIGRLIAEVSHKPSDEDESFEKNQRGERSDFDIFDKKVKVTVEIFD